MTEPTPKRGPGRPLANEAEGPRLRRSPLYLTDVEWDAVQAFIKDMRKVKPKKTQKSSPRPG